MLGSVESTTSLTRGIAIEGRQAPSARPPDPADRPRSAHLAEATNGGRSAFPAPGGRNPGPSPSQAIPPACAGASSFRWPQVHKGGRSREGAPAATGLAGGGADPGGGAGLMRHASDPGGRLEARLQQALVRPQLPIGPWCMPGAVSAELQAAMGCGAPDLVRIDRPGSRAPQAAAARCGVAPAAWSSPRPRCLRCPPGGLQVGRDAAGALSAGLLMRTCGEG